MADNTLTDDTKYILSLAEDFGIDTDDIDVVSSVGFLVKALNDVGDRNALKTVIANRERHVITSDSWDSLLKHALRNSMEVDFAKSSILPINLYVYLDDIEEYGELIETLNGKKKMVITNPKFTVGEYIFRLDYPIEIIQKTVNNIKKYTCQYDTSEHNIISDITNNNIPYKIMYFNSRKCLMLNINVREYDMMETSVNFIDKANSMTMKVSYKNKLQDFNILYKDGYSDTYRTISKAMFVSSTSIGETLYYIMGDGSITFLNKYASGDFYPEPGGTFLFQVYTTNAITFEDFTGNYSVSVDAEADYDLDYEIAGSAIGGADRVTKETFKEQIIYRNTTSDNLIKESDFKAYYKLNGNPGSKYDVKKYVDDYNDRVYNVCLQLNNDDVIIPTNTVDLRISKDYSIIKGQELHSQKNMFLTYNDAQRFINVIVKNDDSSLVIAEEEWKAHPEYYKDIIAGQEIYYALPFQFCYNRKYQVITAYEKIVNTTNITNYTYISEESETTFAVNSLKFFKKAEVGKSKYNITFDLTPNSKDLYTKIHSTKTNDDGSKSIQDLQTLKVVLFFMKNKIVQGYLPVPISYYSTLDELYKMEVNLEFTSPMYDKYIDCKLYSEISGLLEPTTLDVDNTTMRLGVYWYEAGNNPTPVEMEQGLMDFSDYQLMNVFDLNDDVRLFKEVSHIITSQIKKVECTDSAESDNEVVIATLVDKIPFIRYDYYMNNQELVTEEINDELVIMDTIADKIEQQYKMRLNFVNSYGHSYRLRLGLDKFPLDTTHLKLKFIVKLNPYGTLNAQTLKEFINSYFLANDFNDGVSFHMSRLIDACMDEYPNDLILMEFHGVNGNACIHQYITMVEDVEANFIPEVPNIMRDAEDNLLIEIVETNA